MFFFFNDTATTEIYTLSLHDALPISLGLLLDHVTVRPDSGVPFASLGVATSCTVPPTVRLAVAGVTSTVATGTGGALPVIAKLQTVCVPASEYSAQLARLVTAACSVRNAKPVPMVASEPPAGGSEEIGRAHV